MCFALWPDATWRHEQQTLGSTCQKETLGKNFGKIRAQVVPPSTRKAAAADRSQVWPRGWIGQ